MEICMHHPDLPDPPKTVARRRLIRGALSAPALMTVCSGSAFAAGSNMRALANAANAVTPPAAWITPGPDTYLRVPLYKATVSCRSAAQQIAGGSAAPSKLKDSALAGVKNDAGSNAASKSGSQSPNKDCSSSESLFIKGSDLSTFTRSRNMPNPGQYLQIDAKSFMTKGAPVDSFAPTLSADSTSQGQVNQSELSRVNQNIALRFDSSGVIVGVGDSGNVGQGGMVGMSAMVSAFPQFGQR